MFKHSLLFVAMAVPLLGPALAAQEPPELENRIRVGVNDNGMGLEYERKLSRRVGLGVSVFSTRVEAWGGGTWDGWTWDGWTWDWDHWNDRARMTPATVAAVFHMTPGRVVDFYLGPGLAYMTFSDQDRHSRFEDGAAAMFQIGFDVLPRGSKLGFNLDLKHLFDMDDDHEPNIDTATLRLGLVFRF